jgi:DNA repair exonuclease SbcCD ATPase subunit
VLADLDQRFVPELEAAEKLLQSVRDRYDRLKTEHYDHQQLQQHIQDIQKTATHEALPELHAELTQLQAQLTDLEITLDSHLFTWDGFSDVFWMAVRFGGLGILIGWGLKAWAG